MDNIDINKIEIPKPENDDVSGSFKINARYVVAVFISILSILGFIIWWQFKESREEQKDKITSLQKEILILTAKNESLDKQLQNCIIEKTNYQIQFAIQPGRKTLEITPAEQPNGGNYEK